MRDVPKVTGIAGGPAPGTARPEPRSSGRAAVRLDLGCGTKLRPGWIGVDLHVCPAVRVVGEVLRLPFADAVAEEIWLDNVIEHVLDIPALMREVARVGRPGCRVHVLTPHFSSIASWRDPTHVHHLSWFSMEHFEKPATRHYAGGGFAVRGRELKFSRSLPGWIGRAIFALSPETYEKHFCFVFRARTLFFELEVLPKSAAGAEGRTR
jgi:hypothetical protein